MTAKRQEDCTCLQEGQKTGTKKQKKQARDCLPGKVKANLTQGRLQGHEGHDDLEQLSQIYLGKVIILVAFCSEMNVDKEQNTPFARPLT